MIGRTSIFVMGVDVMTLLQNLLAGNSVTESDDCQKPFRSPAEVARPKLMPRALGATLVLALMISACSLTSPDITATWGSDQVSLSISENKAMVQILASGGCYGAFGEIDQSVLFGTFALSGTYTQLMGAYPGSIQYAAEYVGSIAGNTLTLSIRIPSLQQTIGPFQLRAGVTKAWSPCLYP
jgi:hypothetical protein